MTLLMVIGGGTCAVAFTTVIVWVAMSRGRGTTDTPHIASGNQAAPLIGTVVRAAANPLGTASAPPQPAATAPHVDTVLATTPAAPAAAVQPASPPTASKTAFAGFGSFSAFGSSADSSLLVVHSYRQTQPHSDGKLTVWSLLTGEMVRSWEAPAEVGGIVVSDSGKVCVCHAGSQFIVYEVAGNELARCDDHKLSLRGVSEDDRRIIAWDKKQLGVFDIERRSWNTSHDAIPGQIDLGVYSASIDTFAIVNVALQLNDGRPKPVALLQIQQPGTPGSNRHLQLSEAASGHAFSRDGSLLVTLLANGQMQTWRTSDWAPHGLLVRPNDFTTRFKALVPVGNDDTSVAPDGTWLAHRLMYQDARVVSGGVRFMLEIWDLQTHQRRFGLELDNKSITLLALPNERLLVIRSGSSEWLDAKTGQRIAEPFNNMTVPAR